MSIPKQADPTRCQHCGTPLTEVAEDVSEDRLATAFVLINEELDELRRLSKWRSIHHVKAAILEFVAERIRE